MRHKPIKTNSYLRVTWWSRAHHKPIKKPIKTNSYLQVTWWSRAHHKPIKTNSYLRVTWWSRAHHQPIKTNSYLRVMFLWSPGLVPVQLASVEPRMKTTTLVSLTIASFRLGACDWDRARELKCCSDTPVPWTKIAHKQLGNRIDYREIGDKFGVDSSTAYKKANTAGTGENLFRLVPVLGHGARVLPLELVLLPGHGAQISARAPTKGYVQTGARALALPPGTKSERGLCVPRHISRASQSIGEWTGVFLFTWNKTLNWIYKRWSESDSYLAVEVAAHSLLWPGKMKEICSPLFLGISNHIGHNLMNKETTIIQEQKNRELPTFQCGLFFTSRPVMSFNFAKRYRKIRVASPPPPPHPLICPSCFGPTSLVTKQYSSFTPSWYKHTTAPLWQLQK